MADVIRWNARRDGQLWHGEVILPYGPPSASYLPAAQAAKPQVVSIQAKDATQAGAVAKAAGLAEQLISNPIVQAAMPPGTAAAVTALKTVGAGKVLKAAGDGASRLVSALKFW